MKWWNFAVKCVLEEKIRPWTWEHMKRHRFDIKFAPRHLLGNNEVTYLTLHLTSRAKFKEYSNAYSTYLLSKTDKSLKRLEELQNALDITTITLARAVEEEKVRSPVKGLE